MSKKNQKTTEQPREEPQEHVAIDVDADLAQDLDDFKETWEKEIAEKKQKQVAEQHWILKELGLRRTKGDAEHTKEHAGGKKPEVQKKSAPAQQQQQQQQQQTQQQQTPDKSIPPKKGDERPTSGTARLRTGLQPATDADQLVIGIDLGTTRSLAAYYDPGTEATRIFTDHRGLKLQRSLVYVNPDTKVKICGNEAAAKLQS